MSLVNFFNKKNIKKYYKLVTKIRELDRNYSSLLVENIKVKLLEIKNNKNLSNQEKTLHAISIANKASIETLKMSYYDVQIMGALALTDGAISEMKTGEGKTLTCSAAVAANFVLGYKTHVATANEYLAQRDQETLSPLYDCLGISSGYSTSNMEKEDKKIAYSKDVIYSTAQEFGFDFLRDNLVTKIENKIQPLELNQVKAIIDEADFILIDEARTPLIISGESPTKDINLYSALRKIALSLNKMAKEPSESLLDIDEYIPGDFWLDKKHKNIHFSEEGYTNIEKLALQNSLMILDENHNLDLHLSSLYRNNNSWIIHEINNALKAEFLYIKDKDYVVRDNEIVIVDQNTGRLSEGRSWSNGLHQAIEVKENVKINPETITLGSISIQNYFRNYAQISGMSGTIMKSSQEFNDIYNVTTIQIPTNKKMIRVDHQDKIYLTMNAKFDAIIEDIDTRHKKGQPILIGTTSVSESEIISSLLTNKNIKHNVLNAKNNFKEAQIIAQAGKPYSVTVSTSMAGRGTDIILGGNIESILNIVNQQLEQIAEREYFLKSILEQVNLSTENLPLHEETFDYDDISQKISDLYNPEIITDLLNKGINYFHSELYNIKRAIYLYRDFVLENSKNWREFVIQAGGLFVLGSSRNESRRIDDQLRGRAGRQGDPGESNFYLSIEDPWVSIFGRSGIFNHVSKNLNPKEAISAPLISKAFERAQAGIESHHFNSRKDTFQYDSIADEGRRQFLSLRNHLLKDDKYIFDLAKKSYLELLQKFSNDEFLDYLNDKIYNISDDNSVLFNTIINFPITELNGYWNNFINDNPYYIEKNFSSYQNIIDEHIDKTFVDFNSDNIELLNLFSLQTLDKQWADHLTFVDDARQNVAFVSLAQKNPLTEFKKLCFDSFQSLILDFKNNCLNNFFEIKNQKIESEQLVQ